LNINFMVDLTGIVDDFGGATNALSESVFKNDGNYSTMENDIHWRHEAYASISWTSAVVQHIVSFLEAS